MRSETRGTGPYTLYLENNIRTVVDDFWLTKNDTYTFDPNFGYYLCSVRGERSGANVWIRLEDGECVPAENPPVYLSQSAENDLQYVLDLSSVEDQLTPIDEFLTGGEEFILPPALEGDICEAIPPVQDPFDEQIFGKLADGTFLIFDPRLDLQENTPESPVMDGGKEKQLDSGGRTYCSNVPRNFLNEDQCVLSSDACRPSADSQVEVLLEDDTLKLLYNLTSRYVYAMEGLHVVDQVDDGEFPWKLQHPCTDNLRSRWMRKDLTECDPTIIFEGTNKTLSTLLSAETDRNPYIRDIHFSALRGHFCNATDISNTPEVEIEVGDTCWKRVHDDYLSIYDLTYWVDRHPGGPDHITKWAEDDGVFIEFPNRKGGNEHPMYRWHDNSHKFTYVGRYGDMTRIRDLPNDLRTEKVIDYYQDAANIDTSGVLVCGSPGEIASNKAEGFAFDAVNDFITGYWWPDENKSTIWAMINLSAPDQLRQRVAWALAQVSRPIPALSCTSFLKYFCRCLD